MSAVPVSWKKSRSGRRSTAARSWPRAQLRRTGTVRRAGSWPSRAAASSTPPESWGLRPAPWQCWRAVSPSGGSDSGRRRALSPSRWVGPSPKSCARRPRSGRSSSRWTTRNGSTGKATARSRSCFATWTGRRSPCSCRFRPNTARRSWTRSGRGWAASSRERSSGSSRSVPRTSRGSSRTSCRPWRPGSATDSPGGCSPTPPGSPCWRSSCCTRSRRGSTPRRWRAGGRPRSAPWITRSPATCRTRSSPRSESGSGG